MTSASPSVPSAAHVGGVAGVASLAFALGAGQARGQCLPGLLTSKSLPDGTLYVALHSCRLSLLREFLQHSNHLEEGC